MSKTKVVYAGAIIEWAKVREEDRDTAEGVTHEGARKKLEATQGQYTLNHIHEVEKFTDWEPQRGKVAWGKDEMVSAGIPNSGLQAQLFKTNGEGVQFYKATRPHFNQKLVNSETKEQGLVMGPPKIFKLGEDMSLTPFDIEEDGLIGNGTKAILKYLVWNGSITTLEAILVVDHVKYEGGEPSEF